MVGSDGEHDHDGGGDAGVNQPGGEHPQPGQPGGQPGGHPLPGGEHPQPGPGGGHPAPPPQPGGGLPGQPGGGDPGQPGHSASESSTDEEPEQRQPRPRRLVLKPSDFLPKPFSGEENQDPNAFILNFQDYTNLHNLTRDYIILNRFKLCLIGTPRAWLEQAKFKTWKECKPAFIAKYLRLYSRGVAVTEFRSATLGPEERVSDYVVRIKPIAMYLNYSDEIVRDQLLSALPRSCQEAIIMSEGESLDVVVDKADRWFALKKDKTSSGPAVTFSAMDDNEESSSKGIRKQVTVDDGKSGERRSRESRYRDNRSSSRDYRDYRSASRERSRQRDSRRSQSRDPPYRDYSDYDSSDRRPRYYYRSQGKDEVRRYNASSDKKRCYFCDGDHGYLFCRQLKLYMNSKGNDSKSGYSESESRNADRKPRNNGNGNYWKSKENGNPRTERRARGGKSRSNFQ